MIVFNCETKFVLDNNQSIKTWISKTITKEAFQEGDLNYIFCDDNYLLDINVKYLKNSTLTDIISFDYSFAKLISGDIYISVERVKENAEIFKASMEEELHRVMIHGILHFCGYNDKTKEDKELMREKEDYYLSLRDF